MISYKIDDFQKQGGLGVFLNDSPDDFFIVCASYEYRTTVVTENLAEDYIAKKGIIYVNKEFLEGRSEHTVSSNRDKLKESLDRHCDDVKVIEGSWIDSKFQFDELKKALTSKDIDLSSLAITIDISTFNREALLIAIALLRASYPKAIIRTIYVSPVDHGDWLSRGFRCTRNIIGFPGVQQSSKPTLLVVLSGFEPDRVHKVIEEYEPKLVLLGIGDPPTAPPFLERNIEEQKLILARQEVEKFSFPANHIKDCWDRLEDLVVPYLNDFNVILAPMSTKLSTIGALLLGEHHQEIQLAYCVPGEYNIDDYSTGADEIYIEEIPKNGSE